MTVAAPAAGAGEGDLLSPLLLTPRHPERLYRRLAGVPYLDMLGHLHAVLGVCRYFEIGTRKGDSLALARGIAVCVDPALRVGPPAFAGVEEAHFYQITSDDYFARHDPKAVLGGPVQLAFVDGMHHAEFVLRDVLNCEPHLAPDALVVLHDVLPGTAAMARRLQPLEDGSLEPVRGAWTGDVWKVLPLLARWRPEIRVTLLDCPPTGLAVLSGLEPGRGTPRDAVAAMQAELEAMPGSPDALVGWLGGVRVADTARLVAGGPEAIRAAFGLGPG